MKTILALLAILAFAMTATTKAQTGGFSYSPDYEYNMRQAYGPNWRQVFLAAQVATAPNTTRVIVVNPNNGWGNNNCYPYRQPVSWGGNINCGIRPQPMPRVYAPRIRCGW